MPGAECLRLHAARCKRHVLFLLHVVCCRRPGPGFKLTKPKFNRVPNHPNPNPTGFQKNETQTQPGFKISKPVLAENERVFPGPGLGWQFPPERGPVPAELTRERGLAGSDETRWVRAKRGKFWLGCLGLPGVAQPRGSPGLLLP